MSQLGNKSGAKPGSRSTRQQVDPAVVVAFHLVSGRWQVVALRTESGGGRSRLLDSRSLPISDRTSALRYLEERSAGRVLVVLPSSRVICRTCILPNQPTERLIGALRLQAEAHLVGAVPNHRLGMGVLAAAPGENTRMGLIVGWPDSATDSETLTQPFDAAALDRALGAGLTGRAGLAGHDGASSDPTSRTNQAWASDIAALAQLLQGQKLDEPALWVDREAGAIALAMPLAAGGMTMRAVREEFASPDASAGDHVTAGIEKTETAAAAAAATTWSDEILRVVNETSLSAGHGAAQVRAFDASLRQRLLSAGASRDATAALVIPDAARTRVSAQVDGLSTDPAWWNQFGIALGAALTSSGELASLASLHELPPRERPSPVATVTTFLGQPRTAAAMALLAIVLLIFGPLAFSQLRLAVLRWKVPDLAELREKNADESKRRLMYSEMRKQTWPMTKLLADVANCTPEGVEIETLTLSRGDNLVVAGVAKPHGTQKGKPEEKSTAADRIFAMQSQLEETGIFDRVKPTLDPANAMGTISFRIQAGVSAPFREFRYEEEQDFAIKSLAVRKYGPEADPNYVAPDKTSMAEGGAAEENAAASDPPPGEEGEGHKIAGASIGEVKGSRTARSGRSSDKPSDKSAATEGGDTVADASKGDETSEEDAAAEGADGDGAKADGRNVARRPTGDGTAPAGGAATRGSRPGTAAPAVPEPISSEQINAMTKTEAQEALTRVAKARNQGDLDEATTQRLRDEFDQLLKRVREASK